MDSVTSRKAARSRKPSIEVDLLARKSDEPVPLHIKQGSLPISLGKLTSPVHRTARGKPKQFNLSAFEAYGDVLAPRLAESFLSHVAPKRTKSAMTNRVGVSRVFSEVAVTHDTPEWSAEDWRQAMSAACKAVMADETITPSTADSYISDTNGFIRHCQSLKVLPSFALHPGVKNVWMSVSGKPAISELAPTSGSHSELPPEIQQANPEIQECWKQLTELWNVTEPKVMFDRLGMMLDHLRNFAQQRIREHWASFTKTMSEISHDKFLLAEEFKARNEGRTSRALGHGRGSVSAFPDRSSIVSYIEHRHDGLPPHRIEDEKFYRLVVKSYSLKEIQENLFLTTDASVYYLIIILIDTAMNIASALDLNVKSLEVVNKDEGTYKLAWYKIRSDGGRDPKIAYLVRPRQNTLSPDCKDDISLVEVLECLTKLQGRLSRHAPASEADCLFLIGNLHGARDAAPGSERVGLLTDYLEGKAWKRLRDNDPLLKQFPITLDMLRTSVLLMEYFRTNGNIFRVQELGKHVFVDTTIRYIRNISSRQEGVGRVREVQDYLTALATQNLPEIRQELKLSDDDVAAMFARAREKGLGLWGEAEKGSGTPEVNSESSMETWLTGSHKLIIADEMVAAELLTFREHIHRQRSALIQTEAWNATWAPLLVFLNVVLDKFPPEMLVAGQELAEEMEIVFEDLD